ncbi:ribonuclease HII [Salibacterium salarium]|uniref:Ribonuclease HII n=1 Tax=Salibacterium salarium TaxID=284579 RepID=A0A428MZ22_9BACI|nr:ribonuclease HII [Salibacterium salarium]RSL31404.1 ribonuclease HII [Salibacterium salarium]
MKNDTIAAIKQRLFDENPDENWIADLRLDERKGVQKLLSQYDKQMQYNAQLEKAFLASLEYEKQWEAEGYEFIAGVDEVGRGPLAGPVTAAAAILPKDCSFPGLTDSKKLKEEKRNHFHTILTEQALAYKVVHIMADEIDKINIYEASKLAMQQAVEGLGVQADALLIDAMSLPLPLRQLSLTKGDEKSASIAAASVLAKVERDQYMKRLADEYPEYGFEKNMGYGTKVHLEALERLGPTPVHRRSFSPVQNCL